MKEEMIKYENSLQNMFHSLNNNTNNTNESILIYERAIRTKGRNHMQQHIVPINDAKLSTAVTIFNEIINYYNLLFIEININDLRNIENIIIDLSKDMDMDIQMDNGLGIEYFYFQIPLINNKYKRFIYFHTNKQQMNLKTNNQTNRQFPMFLGAEVSVLFNFHA